MNSILRRAAFVALTALACLYTHRYEATETFSQPATGIASLCITTNNGRIACAADSDSAFALQVTKVAYGRNDEDAQQALENVIVTDTVIGTLYDVRASVPNSRRAYGASFVASIPHLVDLTLSTTNGEIAITGMEGDIVARTSNGAVTTTDTRGALDLNTSNGAVNVNVHHGTVDAATSNGAIDCDVAELSAAEHIGIETSNGAVALWLPADISATVDATTSNSSISFAGFGTISFPVNEEHHKQAVIGSGASTVTITTSNGSVTAQAR
jgi:hypothetical protein